MPTKKQETLPALQNNEMVLQEQFADMIISNTLDTPKMQSFIQTLQTEPPANLVKQNKYAGNTKYLPISYLEMLLDQITLGMWEVTNFHYEVIVNELVGKLELKYYHPIAQQYLIRIGTAAVQIQTKSGSDPYNTLNKLPNTLVKQMGQLKAECFRNAVKSIGKAFGRDLNREDAAEFNESYEGDDFTIKMTRKIADNYQNTRNAMQGVRYGSDL